MSKEKLLSEQEIYTLGDQPADLRYPGKTTRYATLREAVAEWHQLEQQVQEAATIKVHDPVRIYDETEIPRLNFGSRSSDEFE